MRVQEYSSSTGRVVPSATLGVWVEDDWSTVDQSQEQFSCSTDEYFRAVSRWYEPAFKLATDEGGLDLIGKGRSRFRSIVQTKRSSADTRSPWERSLDVGSIGCLTDSGLTMEQVQASVSESKTFAQYFIEVSSEPVKTGPRSDSRRLFRTSEHVTLRLRLNATDLGDPIPSVAEAELRQCYERERSRLSAEAQLIAEEAYSDAQRFTRLLQSSSRPAIFISDEGVVTFQWKSNTAGLMVVFAGDGEASFSIKQSGETYSANIREFDPRLGVPGEVRDAVRQFEDHPAEIR